MEVVIVAATGAANILPAKKAVIQVKPLTESRAAEIKRLFVGGYFPLTCIKIIVNFQNMTKQAVTQE